MASPHREQRYSRLPVLLLMSAASGVLLFVGFPPVDMGPVAWVALVPLLVALSQTRTAGHSGACGLVFGLVFHGLYFQFLFKYGTLPWLATTAYQALYPLMFGVVARAVLVAESPAWRVFGAASAWTLVAYLRSYGTPIPFSGGDLAYSQYDQLSLVQMVSIVGQLGMTYVIAAVNVALSQALLARLSPQLIGPATDKRAWARRSAVVAVVCYGTLIAAHIAGGLALKMRQAPTGRELEVAIVQGNVSFDTPTTPQNVQTARTTYEELSRTVAGNADLMIWPESAIPVYLQDYPQFMQELAQQARRSDGYMLIGGMETLQGKYYNSALLYDREGTIVDRYHKMDLVVFGEYVPLRDRLPFLSRYPIRRHDLTPGRERKTFQVEGLKVAPLICFEGMFSRPARQACRLGAQIIAIITSDSWAVGTIEVTQHSNTAPLRAVESRRYVCRAASSGVSAVYSPYGEPLAMVPEHTAGVLSETVYARSSLSMYHRIGDMPLVIVCLVVFSLACFSQRKGR